MKNIKAQYLVCSFFLLSTALLAQEDHNNHPRKLFRAAYADSVNNGLLKEDELKTSVRREAMNNIGDVHVMVNYGSPGVRGRTIWGGLVAYGEVWVTGAHTATSVEFESDVFINKQRIPAGTYAFFTIPGKSEWTLILNKNFNQHLADDYTEKEDVLRIKVKPQSNKLTPRLTYTVDAKSKTQGNITMAWEKIKVSLPISIAP